MFYVSMCMCMGNYGYVYVYVCTQWKEERARISCKHVPSGRFGLVFWGMPPTSCKMGKRPPWTISGQAMAMTAWGDKRVLQLEHLSWHHGGIPNHTVHNWSREFPAPPNRSQQIQGCLGLPPPYKVLPLKGTSWFIEGSLEVKLPTIWTDEKQRWSRRIEKRRAEERRWEKRKSQKKEDAGARKGRKVAKLCLSNDLWLQRVEK